MKRAFLGGFVSLLVSLGVCLPTVSSQTMLISTGAVWRYLDDGSAPADAWRGVAFEDSGWSNGMAPLGYGDGDEATVVRFGPDPNNKPITTYFRHAFTVGDPGAYTNLLVRLLRDDGGVVYLNGAEVFRSNMPTGEVRHTTTALAVAQPRDETNWFFAAPVNPGLLVSGVNVLAVEVHQSAANSTDLSFDLALIANFPPPLVAAGSRWKYLDDHTDPGVDWRSPAFVDDAWPAGDAELGFGDGDEVTTISRTNSLGGTNMTLYFRHTFAVPEPGAYSNLVVRLLRDDGGVVYLNGTEVLRHNMPAGGINAATLAVNTVNAPEEWAFYGTNVSPALLVAGPNVLAVEIHQASLTSSDVSFDLELLGNVPPAPPAIIITRPADNAQFSALDNVAVETEVADFDGAVRRVEFFLDANSVGMDDTEPFGHTLTGLAPGTFALRAVATDDSGLATTSAPVRISIMAPPTMTTLVATGAVWRYLDNGSNQGTAWVAPDFDDSGWPSGLAKFGTNDPAATPIHLGPPTAPYITTYFRTRFVVEPGAAYTNLAFRVLRDDGVVVHLNGFELFRMNLPAGVITNRTPALSGVGGTNEYHYYPTNVGAGRLVAGNNVLAVELHQTASTTDAGFDLELRGVAPPSGPRLSLGRSDTGIVISWPGTAGVLEQSLAVTGGWQAVSPPATSPYHVVPAGGGRFYRLRP